MGTTRIKVARWKNTIPTYGFRSLCVRRRRRRRRSVVRSHRPVRCARKWCTANEYIKTFHPLFARATVRASRHRGAPVRLSGAFCGHRSPDTGWSPLVLLCIQPDPVRERPEEDGVQLKTNRKKKLKTKWQVAGGPLRYFFVCSLLCTIILMYNVYAVIYALQRWAAFSATENPRTVNNW